MKTTMNHFQDSQKEKPNKTMKERRTWPHFLSCTSTTINNKANPATNSPITSVIEKHDSQLAHSFARTFTNSETTTPPHGQHGISGGSYPAWNINSVLAVFPDSPSPICSSGSSLLSHTSFSPISDTFYSQSSCTFSNVSKQSPSSIGIDGWIENGNNLGCSYQPNLQKKGDEAGVNFLGMSSVFESAVTTTIDHEIHSITLPSSNHSCSEAESPIDGRHKLITRPKAYQEFLDQIQQQKLEVEVDAWKEAKRMKYLDRLRKKETCISNWEFKETRKATNEMNKTQRKLERESIKALEKKQKKLSRIQSMAAEKKARERQSTSNKISSATKITDKILVARSLIRLKLVKIVS